MMSLDPNSDRSQRSVFVGNIPYEATEEKLKEIFSEVGPVVSFKLVYDRDNGKPKGYGFCEFRDAQEALSAMRNLNGYEIGGRTLRVDYACTEKSRMEMMLLGGGGSGAAPAGGVAPTGPTPAGMTPLDPASPYGAPVKPSDAPEAISKAVASLAPEDMFKLMRQMKLCIDSNPLEAREMLSKNPQLAYALLQAQVVMRIVDPELAVTMLHKTPPKPFQPPASSIPMGGGPGPTRSGSGPTRSGSGGPMGGGPGGPMGGPGGPMGGPGGPMGGGPSRLPSAPPPMFGQHQQPPYRPQTDFGNQGPHHRQPPMEFDRSRDFDRAPPPAPPPPATRDPRNRDPRGRGGASAGAGPAQPALPSHLMGADPEKAELIMQVLKLTDEQIALLPADQRSSILQLKQQVDQLKP